MTEIKNEILKLNKKIALENDNIWTRVIIENADVSSDDLRNNFSSSIVSSKFPQCLELAKINALYKKGGNILKKNYKTVSVLANVSTTYKKLPFNK